MNPFRAPKSKYQDLFDQERFNFAWHLMIFLVGVFTFLTILHLINSDNNILIAGSALFVCSICILVSYKTRSYIFTAIAGIIGGSAVNQIDLFFIVSSQKFVTTLWILAISLTAFYLLGRKVGLLTLIINMIGVGSAFYVVPKSIQIQRIELRDDFAAILITVNVIAASLFITYLMSQILKTSRIAEERSKVAQEELQQQYNIVQNQNEEKTVMLKEIHHRVKNNLQVIISLLRLQSREIKDPKYTAFFNDSIQRVMAMSLIHEMIYQTEELSKINLKAYLESLVREQIKTYSLDKKIELQVSCEIEFIQPKSLVSFALMFNELISNTLKHGFKHQNEGEIVIEIGHPRKNVVTARYRDNGQWLSPQKEGSFGLELIEDLCEQLDGKFKREIDQGTTYEFEFEYLTLE